MEAELQLNLKVGRPFEVLKISGIQPKWVFMLMLLHWRVCPTDTLRVIIIYLFSLKHPRMLKSRPPPRYWVLPPADFIFLGKKQHFSHWWHWKQSHYHAHTPIHTHTQSFSLQQLQIRELWSAAVMMRPGDEKGRRGRTCLYLDCVSAGAAHVSVRFAQSLSHLFPVGAPGQSSCSSFMCCSIRQAWLMS